jgi:type II secretory pathway pseudopilin PulG
MKGGIKMNNKKAQGELITTVLIILLVIAAVVIVWQVVQSTVRGGADEVEAQGSCIGATLEISGYGTDSVTVKNSGSKTVDGVKIYVNGAMVNSSNATLASGATYIAEDLENDDENAVTIANEDTISAAAVIKDVTCPDYGKTTATGLTAP